MLAAGRRRLVPGQGTVHLTFILCGGEHWAPSDGVAVGSVKEQSREWQGTAGRASTNTGAEG